MNFEKLEQRVVEWSLDRKIIPNSTPLAQFKKMESEMIELKEGLETDDMVEIIDGVGDVLVCLINICALSNINPVECLQVAYNEIKDRKGYMNEEGIFVKVVE